MTPSAVIVVKVKPGAKAPGVVPAGNHVLEVRVRERAVDGKATEAVLRAVAAALGLPASRVSLARGARSRIKWVRLEGVSIESVRGRLTGQVTSR